jgi:hypothetical protein
MDWARMFPVVDKDYTGSKVPYYFLIFVTIISTVRSLIHIFAPDGGANSIAGIAVDGQSGANTVAIFAQWGAVQLLLALLCWLVILRYRFLIPTMLGIIVLEHLFRIGAGQLKPLVVATPPPGATGSLILLPLALIAFLWSLLRPKGKEE